MTNRDLFLMTASRYADVQQLAKYQAETCLLVADYLSECEHAAICRRDRYQVNSLHKRIKDPVFDREIATAVRNLRRAGILPAAISPAWWLVLRWVVIPLIHKLLFGSLEDGLDIDNRGAAGGGMPNTATATGRPVGDHGDVSGQDSQPG